ncbi:MULTISPECIES: hypothetical protein [Lysobacter]|uniref:Transmembrane protein n=1 Tax=Lysobacter firmicutimachus TaxID=1792846 RepID=A0ABU8D2S7_9GAMM|nr:hypothetical protein [Lysobacter antibioticus]
MGRYLILWNWIAIAAVILTAFGGRPSPIGTLFGLAPFVVALASAAWIESSLFALIVRLGSGLFALLMGAMLLSFGFFTASMLWLGALFVALPLLNAVYLEPHREAPPPRRAPRPVPPPQQQPPEA